MIYKTQSTFIAAAALLISTVASARPANPNVDPAMMARITAEQKQLTDLVAAVEPGMTDAAIEKACEDFKEGKAPCLQFSTCIKNLHVKRDSMRPVKQAPIAMESKS